MSCNHVFQADTRGPIRSSISNLPVHLNDAINQHNSDFCDYTLHNQILFYLCVVYNYGNIVQFCCNFCAHDECVKLDLNCIMTNYIEKQFSEIKTKDRKSILCVPLYLYICVSTEYSKSHFQTWLSPCQL